MKMLRMQNGRMLAGLWLLLWLLLWCGIPINAGEGVSAVYEFTAKDTLTAVELNHGDTVRFRLRNGEVRTLVLEATGAEILERPTRLPGIVYGFTCRLRVDGHPLTIQRYVCTQESFYEPLVVNGLRIWFDMVLDAFRKIPMRYPHNGNLRQRPHKDARFALQDATLPTCPQEMQPWYPNEQGWISIGSCYNGEDCWMGPYLGQACHGGMDINHKRGEPLWAPIDFDDQWYFNSLKAGDNNNRWRGIRRWSNGDVWVLQTHHLITLHVPEHTPLKAGTKYADTAGTAVGSHDHTHYEFKIGKLVNGQPPDFDQGGDKLETKIYEEKGDPRSEQAEVIHLDPWILFWQIFEAQRDRNGAIRARMAPLSPAKTGVPVRFSGEGSHKGKDGKALEYYWAFGDGSGARGVAPTHVFGRPGVYPVTLSVDDGHENAAFTQHVTVDGEPTVEPVLGLSAPDELSFRPRPIEAMDAYGQSVQFLPFALDFVARPSRPIPKSREVYLVNLGGGVLPRADAPKIECEGRAGWLAAEIVDVDGQQVVRICVNAKDLSVGAHVARVSVNCPGALNSPQEFTIRLDVREGAPATNLVLNDDGSGFLCTPYFWVGHRFVKRATNYRTNGGRVRAGEIARFTPDLVAGTYDVSFGPKTPFVDGARFDVRVRHRDGEEIVRVEPARSRSIGRFTFEEGTDGFVEIRAEGSEGLVMVDEMVFQSVP
jgi:hypothetical protein